MEMVLIFGNGLDIAGKIGFGGGGGNPSDSVTMGCCPENKVPI